MIFSDNMGIFEGEPKKSGSLFESRGGGRHVAFTALRPTVPEPGVMTAERLTRGEQRMIRREPVLKYSRVRPGVGKPYPEAVIKFKREAAAAYAPMDFTPKNIRHFKGGQPDIRPMGPYQLPDYSSAHPSAEGLNFFGQDTAPVTAPAGESWWKKLAPMVQQGYDAYKGTAKPATGSGYQSSPAYYPAVSASNTTGMSATTITLLVGGGVAVVGIVALILLRK
jgi:hypothetical protein